MIRIKAPGRICLFGEHQDYLNYPVIAMAISKYIYLEASPISESAFQIKMPDIKQSLDILLNGKELVYDSKRDYLKSGYNQFLRKGVRFEKGYKIKITGDIPINAGAASSSALVIAWLSFLNQISNRNLQKLTIANEGYNTEVKEFGEAGGKMDFFTSCYGDFIYLEPKETTPKVIEFHAKLDGFVLGNSLERKETVEDLKRVKSLSIKAFEALKEAMPTFDKYQTSLEQITQYLPSLQKEFQQKVIGNITNRDITMKAKDLFTRNLLTIEKHSSHLDELNTFYNEFGALLIEHQNQLRENIQITTRKIDSMISSALEAGALGAKINGSGFGGTMFALAKFGKEKAIKRALENAGGEAFAIKTSNGVEIE